MGALDAAGEAPGTDAPHGPGTAPAGATSLDMDDSAPASADAASACDGGAAASSGGAALTTAQALEQLRGMFVEELDEDLLGQVRAVLLCMCAAPGLERMPCSCFFDSATLADQRLRGATRISARRALLRPVPRPQQTCRAAVQVLSVADNSVTQAAAMLEESGLTVQHSSQANAAPHSPDAAAAEDASPPPVWPFADEAAASAPEKELVVGVDVGAGVRRDVEARQALYEQLHGASVAEHRARLRELRTQILHAEKRQAWAEVKRLKLQVRARPRPRALCVRG